MQVAYMMAGIPARNAALYHQIRFRVGDPTALIQLGDEPSSAHRMLILRDIELQRARQHARVTAAASPADFTPDGGLSGDRETATAQAAAEYLVRQGVQRVIADRSLPLIYAELLRLRGIAVDCDLDWGILDRRAKDQQELDWLRQAQRVTEGAMQMACQLVGTATCDAEGNLLVDGRPLTAEHVRARIDHWLLERDYVNPPSIVAPGKQGADCHELGRGPLRTGEPVIIDIFPQNRETGYNGDCTRTVVHGDVSADLAAMHTAVLEAKQAAEEATRAGVTGEAVHQATIDTMQRLGFRMGLPSADDPASYCGMTHGTGHGIGLDVHEPPLLDRRGPALVVGDVLTIEPGLYRRDLGGIRVEDMVVVTPGGCENFNSLPTGLHWS